jgi:O-antigen/teichoic acid export membrane protein
MATGEQYLRLAVNFASIAAVSRLLTPAEVGVSVIGTGIMAIALGVREFATSDFLIQRDKVVHDDVRASFTVVLLLTALMTIGVFALAPWFGAFYGEEKLAQFLQISAIAGLIEALSFPTRGLLRRDMAFGTLAFINTASAAVTGVATVLLALAGFSYMSFAWGVLAAAGTTTVLSLYFRPDLSMFRPVFRSWGNVLVFGGYNGASYVINRAYVALPQLVLGHILPPSAVGLFNRACLVSDIPDKVVLTSVFSIAFPALAAESRKGGSLKQPYLRALGLITVLYWPGQVMLVLLAYPIVSLLLGQQWLSVVPLLQVLAIASLAWFPVILTSPVLLALGANRDRVTADFIGRSVAAVIMCSAAWFGIMAMAASKLVTLPFQMVLSLWFVRRHAPFRWREVCAALWKSAVVTAGSATGPAGIVAMSDSGFDLSIAATALAVTVAAAGWLAGVVMVRHPILLELRTMIEAIAETALVRRLRDHAVNYGPRTGEVP